ncbi:site-specific integrase [Vibrio sp. 10N.261.51.F12]|uniref:site-specific integrase n=1 Tax=Vibrio sp. 10N.261.51.F12 TaxID=3229679 RepID=UPI00354EB1EB
MKTLIKYIKHKFTGDNPIDYWVNEYRKYLLGEGQELHTVDENIAKISQVLFLTNKEQISDIRGKDALMAKRLLMQVPSNVHKKKCFKDLDLFQAIAINKALNEQVLAPATVRGKIQACSSFFKYLQKMEVTDINPFCGMKVKAGKSETPNQRFPLTEAQLVILFKFGWFTSGTPKKPYHYWVPLLLRYTGARLNEVCQLRAENIIQRNNIWYILITDEGEEQRVKTKNSVRQVPIAKELLRLGFIEFATNLSGELFPELPVRKGMKSTNATKWAQYWRDKNGFGTGHDLHSLRHNFTSELMKSGIKEELANALVGHSKHGFTYSTYGHSYPLDLLAECVNTIDTSFTKHVTPYHQ